MIGRLEKTVFDCPDPRALAAFYAAILGMRVNEDSDDWVVIGTEPGARQLAFQRVAHFSPPAWGDPHRPQQLHVDIRVDDVDTAERQVPALGATRLPGELPGCPGSCPADTASSPTRWATRFAACSGGTPPNSPSPTSRLPIGVGRSPHRR